MKIRPKVSITVPVYNQEVLLSKCVASLTNQTLKDIEIILVDDGSTDDSPRICDDYCKIDPRIRVIHKSNGGSASARQAALDIMTGEFSSVCDSDDWVEPCMYEKMYQAALSSASDIVICGIFYDYADGTTRESVPKTSILSSDSILSDVLLDKFPSSTCNRLISLDFIRKHNLSYVDGVNVGEDFLFSVKCALKAARYSVVEEPLYHYYRRPGEETYTNNLNLSSHYQLVETIKWLENNLDGRVYAKGIFHRRVNLVFSAMRTKGMTSGLLRDSVLKDLKLRDFWVHRAFALKDLYALFVLLFGFKAGLIAMKLLYNLFYK